MRLERIDEIEIAAAERTPRPAALKHDAAVQHKSEFHIGMQMRGTLLHPNEKDVQIAELFIGNHFVFTGHSSPPSRRDSAYVCNSLSHRWKSSVRREGRVIEAAKRLPRRGGAAPHNHLGSDVLKSRSGFQRRRFYAIFGNRARRFVQRQEICPSAAHTFLQIHLNAAAETPLSARDRVCGTFHTARRNVQQARDRARWSP